MPTPDDEWFALTTEGEMVNLGRCEDFEAAEHVAEDGGDRGVMWIADPETARQWRDVLNRRVTP